VRRYRTKRDVNKCVARREVQTYVTGRREDTHMGRHARTHRHTRTNRKAQISNASKGGANVTRRLDGCITSSTLETQGCTVSESKGVADCSDMVTSGVPSRSDCSLRYEHAATVTSSTMDTCLAAHAPVQIRPPCACMTDGTYLLTDGKVDSVFPSCRRDDGSPRCELECA
jgi:hypothetical protein